MKPSIFFTFIVFFVSASSLSSAQSPPYIRDTDKNILRTGTGYYILPVVRGRGGGVTLAPSRINQTCPDDLVQENNELRNGLPWSFTLAKTNKDGYIFESNDINIKYFSRSDKSCVQARVWRVEVANGQRVVSSHGVVGNPGQQTISNWFKIEKYEEAYKLVYCPTVCKTCRPACGDIGSTIAKNGRRSLLLSSDPLKVMFKKA